MTTLIVYYSMGGNTEWTARKIAEELGAEMLRLEPVKAYPDSGFAKFFWGGKSAVMAEKPALEPYDADLSEYGRIILGFPVWASNFTPPLRTFLADNAAEVKGKQIAAFACQSGAGAEKALAKLQKFLGIPAFEATAVFIDPKAKQSKETDEAIDAFCEALQEAAI